MNSDNIPFKIYVDKIENRVKPKFKNKYSCELLVLETWNLLVSSQLETAKDKNWEKLPNYRAKMLFYVSESCK